jgi:hypothetical protein
MSLAWLMISPASWVSIFGPVPTPTMIMISPAFDPIGFDYAAFD